MGASERSLLTAQDTRLAELTNRSNSGVLTPEEQHELENLIDRLDQEVLLRSQALLLLKQRGHDVELRLQMEL